MERSIATGIIAGAGQTVFQLRMRFLFSLVTCAANKSRDSGSMLYLILAVEIRQVMEISNVCA
jgi:hypothetical protein